MIEECPIELLHGHPYNPRPWSETHQMRVTEREVRRLAELIGRQGFDPHQPIQSVPHPTLPGQRTIVVGHNRYCASKLVGLSEVPHVPLGISWEEGCLRLIAHQGHSVDPWCAAQHAFEMRREGISARDYARATGLKESLVHKRLRAYEVKTSLAARGASIPIGNVSSAAIIARAKEEDWGWLAELAAANSWSNDRLEIAIRNYLLISTDPVSADWLDIKRWQKKAVLEPTSTLAEEINSWSQTDAILRQDIPAECRDRYVAGLQTESSPSSYSIRKWAELVVADESATIAEIEPDMDGVILVADAMTEISKGDFSDACKLLSADGSLIAIVSLEYMSRAVESATKAGLTLVNRLFLVDKEIGNFADACRDVLIFSRRPTSRIDWRDLQNIFLDFDSSIAAISGKSIDVLADLCLPDGGSLLAYRGRFQNPVRSTCKFINGA